MDKKSLRKAVKERIASMTDDEKRSESAAIAKKIESFSFKGKKIFIYNALPDEADTREIIGFLSKDNAVYLPVVDGDDMLLAKYGDKETEGAYGIYEPEGRRFSASKIMPDICITPLRAFDLNLNRLGRGKGYYDRFFCVCDCTKIALAFDCQLVDEIPTESNDVRVDTVVTATMTYGK